MAGAGYKLFQTGDVLTATEVNTYLQQQVTMVFANSAARTSALSGVLAEGMMSYLQDTNLVEVYDGSSWVSVGNTGDITAVTAGTGLTGGGTSGAVTLTNDMATTITTKGDILVGTGAGTYARLGVGSNNSIIVADSGETTGLKWAAPSGGDFVRITSQSFSAASTINVNDVFSSTYKMYKVFINAAHSTGAVNCFFRFRVSGSDDTTSNYSYQRLILNATTFSNNRGTGEDKATIADFNTANSNQELTIFNPFESKLSYLYAYSSYEAATPAIQQWYNGFNATTSFTGFTVYVISGSLTGEILVYGMKV